MTTPNYKNIFDELYFAPTEEAVDDILKLYPDLFKNENWLPLGGDERMFGIIRGQQSNPIAALVEKVTNSIDALLMRKCYEAGIDPQSSSAPRTMDEAIQKFYPKHKEWDLQTFRREQAKEIQILAVKPLATFESKRYQQLIFSDDEKKTEGYNLLFNEAIKLDAEGNKNEALILFEKCVLMRPSDGETYGALANTLADMRLFDNSFYAFKKAMQLIPNDPYISRNFSLALLEAGKFYDGLILAIRVYEKYPLLGDIKILFETNFERCLKQGLLNSEQLIELQNKWSSLN